jgi:hypothetical protein
MFGHVAMMGLVMMGCNRPFAVCRINSSKHPVSNQRVNQLKSPCIAFSLEVTIQHFVKDRIGIRYTRKQRHGRFEFQVVRPAENIGN